MGIRIKKALARIGVACLLLLSLGLMVRAVFNYSNGKRLELYLDELRAEGAPLDRRAALSTCPDRDNGALLWKAAEALLLLEHDDKDFLSRKIVDIDSWADLDEKSMTRLEEIVARNRKVINLVTEAASKPCFRYRDESQSGTIGQPNDEVPTPDVIRVIQAMRVFALDALLETGAGRVDKATDRILTGLAFQRLLLDDPSLIGYLISVASAKMLLVTLNRIASGREMDSETLSRAISALDSRIWRTDMARVFEFENAHSVQSASRRIRGGEPLSDLDSRWSDRAFSWVFRPVIKSEIVWVSRLWKSMTEAALLPFHENERIMSLNTEQAENPPRLYRMTGLLMPHLATVMLKEASLEAQIDASRIGLACKIHRLQTGRFPERIVDLVPDLLEEEPLDPFTGEPFVYRTKGDGFIVYSLGSNKKDDGGKSSPMTRMVMEKDDDWAWRENWDR